MIIQVMKIPPNPRLFNPLPLRLVYGNPVKSIFKVNFRSSPSKHLRHVTQTHSSFTQPQKHVKSPMKSKFVFERSRILWYSELFLALLNAKAQARTSLGWRVFLRFTSQIAPCLNRDLSSIHLIKLSLTKNLNEEMGICLCSTLFLRTPCTVNIVHF